MSNRDPWKGGHLMARLAVESFLSLQIFPAQGLRLNSTDFADPTKYYFDQSAISRGRSGAAGNSLGDLHNGGGQSSVPRFTRVHTGVHTRVHTGIHSRVQKGTLGYTKGSP